MMTVQAAATASQLASGNLLQGDQITICSSRRRRLQLLQHSAKFAPVHPSLIVCAAAATPASAATQPTKPMSAVLNVLNRPRIKSKKLSEDHELPIDWRRQFPAIGERSQLVRYYRKLQQINAIESQLLLLSDTELKAKTKEFKSRLKRGSTTEELLPEAFAVVREAAQRVLGMRHFDVQMVGGMVMFEGKIAEMQTGEGKTLVSTLPAYLWGITGLGVHMVTVNDYLASRDASSMGKVFNFLGLSVGVFGSEASQAEGIREFAKDITYVTGQQLAFTYLRDNCSTARTVGELVLQRPLHAVIIDEVDSVLIDESQIPLQINSVVTSPGQARRGWRFAVANRVAIQLRTTGDGCQQLLARAIPTAETKAVWEGWPAKEFVSKLLLSNMKPDSQQQQRPYRWVELCADSSMMRHQDLAMDLVNAETEYNELRDAGRNGNPTIQLKLHSLKKVIAARMEELEAWKFMYQLLVPLEQLPPCMTLYEQLIEVDTDGRLSVRASEALAIRELCLELMVEGPFVPAELNACSEAGFFPEEVVAAAGYTLRRPLPSELASCKTTVEAVGTLVRTNVEHFKVHRHRQVAHLTPEGSRLAANILRDELWRQVEAQRLLGQAAAARAAGDPLAADHQRAAEELLNATSPTQEPAPPSFRPTKELMWGFDQPWGVFVALALRVQSLFRRDVEYIVLDGQVVIIDPITGRAKPDSRWASGIHQAIEAREGLSVQKENRTSAQTTFQSFFRYYDHLCGMTGTAATEADEFSDTYNLQVQRVPTNKPKQCLDFRPVLFQTQAAKHEWIAARVSGWRQRLRPVLIGTADVDESEAISQALLRRGVEHQVLNAKPKHLRRESQIIAEAGIPGCVTIATNMAGRGTDIALGGTPKGLVQRLMEHYMMPCLATGVETLPIPPFPHCKSPEQLFRALPRKVQAARLAANALLDPRASDKRCEKAAALQKLEALVEDAEVLHARTLAAISRHEPYEARAKVAEDVLDAWQNEVYRPSPESNPEPEPFSASSSSKASSNAAKVQSAPGERERDGADVSMVKLAVLLWLWMDDMCRSMSQQATRAGGLLIVGAFVPHLKRVELQLKGRAGRQGSPGTTMLAIDLEDRRFRSGTAAVLAVMTRMMQLLGHSKATHVDQGFDDILVGQAIALVQRSNARVARQSRDLTRDHDMVVDPVRAQTYAHRRQLVGGSPFDFSRLIQTYILMEADDLVDEWVNPSAPPAQWPLIRTPEKAADYEATLERLLAEEATAAERYHAATAAMEAADAQSDVAVQAQDRSQQHDEKSVSSPIAAAASAAMSAYDAQEAARKVLVAAENTVDAHCSSLDPQPAALTVAFEDCVNPPNSVDHQVSDVLLDVSYLPAHQRAKAQAAFERQKMIHTSSLPVLWQPGGKPSSQPAMALHRALTDNTPLPPPPDPAALGHPPPPIYWAASLSTLRHQRATMERPPLQGRHSQRASALRDWLSEALLAAYVAKAEMAVAASAQTSIPPHRIAVDHFWPNFEQDTLISQLDDRWQDFLQLTGALREISIVRAYGEQALHIFKLEVRSAYAQLLVDFRKRSLRKLFLGPAASQSIWDGRG